MRKRKVSVCALLCAAILVLNFQAYAITNLPAGTVVIEDEAFCGTSMAYIVLPDSVQRIGHRAFADSSVIMMKLPASLKFIADDAFAGCAYLELRVEQDTYAYSWARSGHAENVMTAPNVSAPVNIPAGKDFLMSIEAIPEARYYYGWYIDETGESEIIVNANKLDSIFISGKKTTPGERLITITAVKEAGGSTTTICKVNITGERPATPMPTVSKKTVRIDEPFTFALNTKGVDLVQYEYYANGFGRFETVSATGNTTSLTFSQEEAGRYYYNFMYCVDDIWYQPSDYTVVEVTQ